MSPLTLSNVLRKGCAILHLDKSTWLWGRDWHVREALRLESLFESTWAECLLRHLAFWIRPTTQTRHMSSSFSTCVHGFEQVESNKHAILMHWRSYEESSRPSVTGITGPSHSATAAAPATAIKSAQDTATMPTLMNSTKDYYSPPAPPT
jgi:hypothetical protein